MTKEKPIGLIVGLLFIIGFGLILSMLMGTEDKLPPRSAAAEENTEAYASAHAIDDSARFTPLPTGADFSSAVAGGGAIGNSGVESRMGAPSNDDREGVIVSELRPGTATLAAGLMPENNTQPPRGADPVIAGATGHTTIYVGPDGVSREHIIGQAGVASEAGRGRTHVVEAGDNLTRIALKYYGPGKDREYKRIYEANRGAMRGESDLSIGQELIIPPLPAPASASAPVDVTSGRPAGVPADRAGHGRYVSATMDDLSGTLSSMGRRTVPAAAPAGRSYVVQRGDRLKTIARRMMNDDSPAAVRRLYEANRGVLESPDRLRIGVQLKLP